MMNVIPVITLFGGLAAFLTFAVTLSFAVGKIQMIDDKALVARADQAKYRVKKGGHNQVEVGA